MENLEKILASHPFLEGMSPEQISLLSGCAANVVFREGEMIFHEGDPATSFYFIRSGKVNIEAHIPQKGSVPIRTRRSGEVFGWSWILEPYRWHFDARSMEVTRAIVLDGKCLREKCENDHDLGYEIMKRFAHVIAERLEATRLQLLDVYGSPSN